MKKRVFIAVITLFSLTIILSGCGPFWRGAGVGVVGTGAAYEINVKRQLDKLNRDYESGRISKEEYDIRTDQIKKGSIVY